MEQATVTIGLTARGDRYPWFVFNRYFATLSYRLTLILVGIASTVTVRKKNKLSLRLFFVLQVTKSWTRAWERGYCKSATDITCSGDRNVSSSLALVYRLFFLMALTHTLILKLQIVYTQWIFLRGVVLRAQTALYPTRACKELFPKLFEACDLLI